MESQNTMQVVTQVVRAKDLFNREDVKQKFQELLGKKAPAFITSVLQIVSQSTLLANADPNSVYQSAATAATMDLPLNKNLGFAYIVPYNESYKDNQGQWHKRQVAQFQMGYKGFIQLSQRSGQFLTINATDVREGEMKTKDKLTGKMTFEWIEDDDVREKLPIIGYVAFFELLNGFKKMHYMSMSKVKQHAARYSQAFKGNSGPWIDDFDSMALKTVLKLLLSKFAPLSIEMQKAVIVDQAIIKDSDTLDVTYPDNDGGAFDPVDYEEDMIAMFEQKKHLLTPDELKDAERIIAGKETNSYKKLITLINSKGDE